MFLWAFSTVQASDSNDSFVVTAYYSPLPNQNYYLKGNYEDELILNGMWIKGASGKPVFSWMLAAPETYWFWTKILLQGLGIGSVEDRGGAIVSAGNRGYKSDRIDVWMGKGEEWLRRALYWGKRTIQWYIVKSDTPVSLDIENVPAPSWSVAGLPEVNNYFNVSLWMKSSSWDVLTVQQKLTEMWLYTGALDWKYASIVDVIFDYQRTQGIVKDLNSSGAGYFWPKTREKLKKDYLTYLDKKIFEEKRKKFLEDKFRALDDISSKQTTQRISKIWNPSLWEVWPHVRELQKLLKELGYFQDKDTAIFWEKTKQGIFAFQKDKNLVMQEADIWAWILGPKTKKTLEEHYKKVVLSQLLASQTEFTVEELEKQGIYKS